MNISCRAFLHRLITYPLLIPLMLLYVVVYNKNVVLNVFYWLRGIPHGYLKRDVRIAQYHGFKIIFPFNEDPSFDDVWLRDVYWQYLPKQNDVVIDVGAHMGFFSMKIAKSVKKVFAIEPDPFNFQFLVYNICSNKLDKKVVLYNVALGKKRGKIFLDRNVYGHGRSKPSVTKTDYQSDMYPLDELVTSGGLRTVNLIKIDTEGFELEVLKGSVKTLQQSKPDLIIAAYHFPQEAQLVSDFLKKYRYSVFYYYVPFFLSGGKEIYLYAKANSTNVSELCC
jgi:FkbM family methyltransferase